MIPRVIDVREPSEFGAVTPGSESLAAVFVDDGRFGFDNDKPVVLVCRSGRRSKRAVAMLHEQGCRRDHFGWRHVGMGRGAFVDGCPVRNASYGGEMNELQRNLGLDLVE